MKALPAEDTWKDIVRIKKRYRKDHKGRRIPRGSICRLTVGNSGASKWVIVHGREPEDPAVQMDLNVRPALGLRAEEQYEFTIYRLPWIQTLWFPWFASDPMYRLPAQFGVVSFVVGAAPAVLGILVALK